MKIGAAVRHYRAKMDISQEAAARLADVSLATWNAVENDKTSPTLQTTSQMASALRVTVADLLAFRGETEAA